MARRKLPIGIQTFRTIREDRCYYVDKTPLMHRLAAEGTHYFLSRPRRFGKSLFLDTLKELFEGSEALFEGLHIHRRWDWSVRHPVVRLSFGSGNFQEPGELRAETMARLDDLEEDAEVAGRHDGAPARRQKVPARRGAPAGSQAVGDLVHRQCVAALIDASAAGRHVPGAVIGRRERHPAVGPHPTVIVRRIGDRLSAYHGLSDTDYGKDVPPPRPRPEAVKVHFACTVKPGDRDPDRYARRGVQARPVQAAPQDHAPPDVRSPVPLLRPAFDPGRPGPLARASRSSARSRVRSSGGMSSGTDA